MSCCEVPGKLIRDDMRQCSFLTSSTKILTLDNFDVYFP